MERAAYPESGGGRGAGLRHSRIDSEAADDGRSVVDAHQHYGLSRRRGLAGLVGREARHALPDASVTR